MLLVVVLLFSLALGVVLLLPRFYRLKQSQNILFINKDKSGQIKQIYLASYLEHLDQVLWQQLDQTKSVKVIQDQALQEVKLGQLTTQADFSWGSEVLINRSYTLNCSSLGKETVKRAELSHCLWQELKNKLGQGIPLELIQPTQRQLVSIFFTLRQAQFEFKAANPGEISLSELRDQQAACAVAVLNTTQISGLAGKLSRVIENSGYRVIRVDSADYQVKQSTVVFKQNNQVCSDLYQQLKPLFTKLDAHQSQPSELFNRYRADLVILLGKEI